MLLPRPCQSLLLPNGDGAGTDDGLTPKPPAPKGDGCLLAVEANVEGPNPAAAGAGTPPKGDGAGTVDTPKQELVAADANPKPEDCPPPPPNGLGATPGLGAVAGAKPVEGAGAVSTIPNPDN